jgi:hypothetical protein
MQYNQPKRLLDDAGLRTFWHKWLTYAADALLYTVGVFGGKRYTLLQREVVLQFWDYPKRAYCFRTIAEIHDTLKAMYHPPVNMHFGPLWPAYHMALQPLLRVEDNYAPEFVPNIDIIKPRDFDRREHSDSARGELVIDVDMDVTRRIVLGCCPCGDANRVCQTCWTLIMLPAQRILYYLLRDYFGMKRFFCVFSGRRGFHIWLVDERVIEWTGSERRTFAAKLSAPLRNILPDEFDDPMIDYIWERVIRDQWQLEAYRRVQGVANQRASAFAMLWPAIDEPVAAEASHLHKLPLVLNQHTGYWCDLMADPDSPHRFVARATRPNKQLLTLDEIDDRMWAGCIAELQRIMSIQ